MTRTSEHQHHAVGNIFHVGSFLRHARARNQTAKVTRISWVDVYLFLFIGAAVVAWIWGAVTALRTEGASLIAASGPGGALYRDSASWLGPGAPGVGVALLGLWAFTWLLRVLLVCGPIGAEPSWFWWVRRLPAYPLRRWSPSTRLVFALSLIVPGVMACIVAAAIRWSEHHPWMWAGAMLSLGVVAGAVGFITACGLQNRRAGVGRSVDLPGWELRRAGSATRHLGNALALGSGPAVREILTSSTRNDMSGKHPGLPKWAVGPYPVLLYATWAAEDKKQLRNTVLVTLGTVVVILICFSHIIVLAAWASLAFCAFRGLRLGTTYLADLRMGSAAENLLPLSSKHAAWVRLAVPCALNTTFLGGIAVLLALATHTAVLPVVITAIVAGLGVGAVGAHRILAPAANHAETPLDTPFGPLPLSLITAAFRGVAMTVALAALPAILLVFPVIWPWEIAASCLLTGVSLASAVRTGSRA